MSDRIRRVFVAVTPAPGERLMLDQDESHHVARVLRLKAGDAVSVFDGRGGEWEATVDEASREGVRVVVGRPRTDEVEPSLPVLLHQAIVRPEKIEWVLQKGTEIGLAGFRLFPAARVEAPPPSPSRLTRYRRILLEACKQSGRRRLPELTLGTLQAPTVGVLAIVLADGAGVSPLGALLDGPAASEVWLAVGPEGGFAEAEIGAAEQLGWRRASLGPRVLRTETAGAVAGAIVLNRWADLGPAPAGAPPAPPD